MTCATRRRMTRLGLALALVAPFVSAFVPKAARAAEPVDMLLVLATDVSRSVTEPKFRLQRDGTAAALTHPDVVKAIASGPNRRIAVCLVEWAAMGMQTVVVDWTPIAGEADARRFGDKVVETPRSFAGSTSLSSAIDYRPAAPARDEALEKGITINALVILTPEGQSFRPEHTNPAGGLEKYFRDNVIGGPGAFTVVAEGHAAFERALTKKLIQEIARLPGRRLAAVGMGLTINSSEPMPH